MTSSWHLWSILVSTGAGVEGGEDKMALDGEPTIMVDQAKLKSLLIKRLERLDVSIGEKLVTEKTDAIHMRELERDMFAVQDQLLRLQAKRKDQQQEKAEGEAKRQRVHKELDVAKNMHTMMADKLRKEKAYVSQLEKIADSLMQHLVYTQAVHEDLRSKGKAMKTFTSKAEAEKAQATVDKLKQELYVDRLTKDLEKVTQQAAVYKVHATAQARQTQELKQVLSETESVKASLLMEHNQLFQQWNSSLTALEKQDKAFNEMQEALHNAKIVASTLHRELNGYNKFIKEEKEKNETLMRKLDRLQLEDAMSKNLMGQMQAKQEDLQAQYSTCLHILQDTEHTCHRLKKESKALVDEMSNQRKKLEKESTVRLELEGKIMAQMQQKLLHNKFSQQPTSNLAALKKEKISQLWQLEDELKSLGQECSEIGQQLDSLKLTQHALDQDIIKNEKLVTANQAVMNAIFSRVKQNHAFIDINNKKIQQVREKTGHEVLSPLEIQAETLAKQNEELAETNKGNRQLWEKQQGALIQLAQEKKTSTTVFLDMQTKYCVLNQRKIRVESQIELERREKAELVRHLKTLVGDRLRLNTLISRNTQLSQALELENALKETDNLCKIKEAARERAEMKMKQEETQEEKEMLQNYLVEADMQIKLWERKIQLLRETRLAVDSEREDIDMMKAEIHNKEVWLNQLRKQQFDLQRESGAAFARRESVLLYRDVMVHSLRKQTKNDEQYHVIKSLKRRIKNTYTDVAGAEQKIRELQESKDSLSNSIGQQKQRIMELRARNYALDNEIEKLEDDKDRNLFLLIALQTWAKQLRMVCEGKHQGSGDATSESLDTALQRHQEFVDAASTTLHHVCEELPQHRVVLRRPLLMLEAQQELSKV